MNKIDFLNHWPDLKTVKTVEKLLEWAEIADKYQKIFIVQGGYTVDLAFGKITRNHDDLDVITLEKDLDWFKECLITDGYKIKVHEGHNPKLTFCSYKYNFLAEASIYIDWEGINIDTEVWDRGDGEKYVWPIKPEDLYLTTYIDQIPVKYLNPKLIYDFKKKQQEKGWDIREKEEHDFEILKKIISVG